MFKEKSLAAMSVEFIIGLAIGLYVLVAIIPGAIANFANADTGSCWYANTSFNSSVTNCTPFWTPSTIALWGLIPLIVIVGVVIVIYRNK